MLSILSPINAKKWRSYEGGFSTLGIEPITMTWWLFCVVSNSGCQTLEDVYERFGN